MSAGIPAAVRAWIQAESEGGAQPAALLHALRASGWADAQSLAALSATLGGDFTDLPRQLDEETVIAPAHLPGPDLDGDPPVITAFDRRVRVLARLQSPQVVVFGGLLSGRECSALIAASRPWLQRSPVVDVDSGGHRHSELRTSEGVAFERGHSALVERIEARIAALLRWPVDHGEGLQTLRYGPGAEYQPHHDYFEPDAPGTATLLQRGGQRVGTLIIYLRAPDAGGATVFPELGLSVTPIRGNAVFFSYGRPDPATRTLHAGAPVLAGEKWIATKWLRERPHR